jgi:acyl-CoA oxidase
MEAWAKVTYHIMKHEDGKYFRDNLTQYEDN